MRSEFTLGIIGTCLYLAGCARTHPALVDYDPAPYQHQTRVQWNSSGLKSLLAIDKADVERTDTGLLRVRLALRNRTRDNIWVDIRTVFTDEKGFELEKTNWEPFCCTARTVETYETVSLGANARDYQLIIRDPRESKPGP